MNRLPRPACANIITKAHCIKYYQSLTSLAMREINACYRWAISGTPITNGPNELYPYFRLLKVPLTGSHRDYCQNYDVKTNQGQMRLQALLNKYMIRRTATDQMFGQPILLLPKATQKTHWVHFNPVERAIYNIVHNKAVEQINRESRLGKLNLNFVLVRILRLRQICSHPLLAMDAANEMFTPDDLKKLEELAKMESHPKNGQARHQQIITLRKMLKRRGQRTIESIDLTGDSEPEPTNKPEDNNRFMEAGTHGLKYDIMKYIEQERKAAGVEDVAPDQRCGSCGLAPPLKPLQTSCGHIYCSPCIDKITVSAAMVGKRHGNCVVCEVEYSGTVECSFATKIKEEEVPNRPKTEDKKAKKRPDAFLDGMDDDDILSSAKTLGCKAYIMNCIDDAKDGENIKIILFSQFVGMLCILRRMCDQEGWKPFMFYGGMKREERSKTISDFEEFQGHCILLSSLKCGGLGLNLTAASQVLNIDPFWNVAIEQQAFGRVHRIGQTKQTNFTRLFVSGTIDERILNLQEEKQHYIQRLFEGSKKVGLKNEYLLQLFGDTSTDANGNIFVHPADNYEKAPFFDDNAWEHWQDGADKRQRMEIPRYY
jgi:SNF2 family DNA or RNA helicase